MRKSTSLVLTYQCPLRIFVGSVEVGGQVPLDSSMKIANYSLKSNKGEQVLQMTKSYGREVNMHNEKRSNKTRMSCNDSERHRMGNDQHL